MHEAWRGLRGLCSQSPETCKQPALSPGGLCLSHCVSPCAAGKTIHRAFPKGGSTSIAGVF